MLKQPLRLTQTPQTEQDNSIHLIKKQLDLITVKNEIAEYGKNILTF